MLSTATILLICGVFMIGQVTGQELLSASAPLEKDSCIPSENWYAANISPVSKVPNNVDYGSISCSIVDSFLETMMNEYARNGFLNANNKDTYEACKKTVCQNPAMLEKLTDPIVAAEFVFLMASLVEEEHILREDVHTLFKFVTDPTYWEIIKDLPEFPLVIPDHFEYQAETAFKIISKVCGHQTETLRRKLSVEVVTDIFIGILIHEYIPGVDIEKIRMEMITPYEDTYEFWKTIASSRIRDGACLDTNLLSSHERQSITRIRHIATNLGVECGLKVEKEIGDYDEDSSGSGDRSIDFENDEGSTSGSGDTPAFEYVNSYFPMVGVAPGSPGGSSGGPPSSPTGGGSAPPASGISSPLAPGK